MALQRNVLDDSVKGDREIAEPADWGILWASEQRDVVNHSTGPLREEIMNRPAQFSRMPVTLPPALHGQLNWYALAANAAGVSLLALAQPADAKIVYTPAHTKVGLNRTVPIDLNHDGIHDFGVTNITFNSESFYGDNVYAEALNSGNQIWAQRTSRGFKNSALALRAGVRVGPSGKHFASGRDGMAFCDAGVGTSSGGPWKNVTNRFLGLKFLIKGKAHYGWARLNVSIAHAQINAVLTGYAYETVANKAIMTGKTKSSATLGELALGGR